MASEDEAALTAAAPTPADSPTIFDKIIDKDIPADVVYEDNKGHTSAGSGSHHYHPQG